MDLLERARAYVSKCPPAVSGQNGHATTFNVAVALVHGFSLSESDAWPIFSDYNRSCSPPWSESELRHKLQSAVTTPHAKPRGFLLGSGRPPSVNGYRPMPAPEQAPSKLVAPVFDVPDTLELPTPLTDGTRALLRACFLDGDAVRIVSARLNDEGVEEPDGVGPILPRAEWLAKFDGASGDPNALWKAKARTGIYVGMNPVKVGSRANDADVTSFRHALIEFDSLSIDEQWNIYSQSALPCSAVISSGKKSLHAWVRVDAKDRQEYDQRVRFLFDYFAPYGPDVKNRNPARLSRLPNCIRFDKRQELLALNVGAASWDDWMLEVERSDLKAFSWAELAKPVSMSDNLLGNRFLERGQGVILYGPSGCGKSVAALQAQVEWAAGLAGLHIKPERPLRVVVLQTEDSVNDLRENLAGIMEVIDPACLPLVRQNLILLPPVPGGDEESLTRLIDRVASLYKPDLVSVNPLLAFCSADPSKNLGTLLYQHVDPVIKKHRVGFLAVHHTPKTNRMDTRGYGQFDHQYLAAGDARVANWPRAMVQIEPVAGDVYLFRIAKRSSRSGWRWDNKPTNERYFRHHKPIRWVDATPEDAKAAQAKAADEDYRVLATVLPADGQVTRERVIELARKGLNIGKHKAQEWLKLCLEDKLVYRIDTMSENKRRMVLYQRPKLAAADA